MYILIYEVNEKQKDMYLGHGDYMYQYNTVQPVHYLVFPKSCFMIVYRLSAGNQFMKTISLLLKDTSL